MFFSYQSYVIAETTRTIEVWMLHYPVNIEILHYQRLINGVQLVLAEPDLQVPWLIDLNNISFNIVHISIIINQ